MSRLLVLYASQDGHTGRIAETLAQHWRRYRHVVTVLRADHLPAPLNLRDWDAVILGASVHFGRHQAAVGQFLGDHREQLVGRFSAFFSVSGAAGYGDAENQGHARRYLEQALAEWGWQPDLSACFAGALDFPRYPWWKRWLLQRVHRQLGGISSGDRRHEMTDWAAVHRFAEAVQQALVKSVPEGPAPAAGPTVDAHHQAPAAAKPEGGEVA